MIALFKRVVICGIIVLLALSTTRWSSHELKALPREKQEITAADWTLNGFTYASNVVSASGKSVYGHGVSYKPLLDTTGKIEVDFRYTQVPAALEWTAITLGLDNQSFNNPAKGVTFILFKKSNEHIATDTTWYQFPFNEENRLFVSKESDRWDLLLENSQLPVPTVIGSVPFTQVPSDLFADQGNKALLTMYYYSQDGAADKDIALDVYKISTHQAGVETVESLAANKFQTIDEFAVDNTGAVLFRGPMNYQDRVTYQRPIDVSEGVSFDLQFTDMDLQASDPFWYSIRLGADASTYDNGVSFIAYRKAAAAIEFGEGGLGWHDFPFSEKNTLTLQQGNDDWELYLTNSIVTTPKLVAKVPYSTVASDYFTDDQAYFTLSFQAAPDTTVPIDFTISNFTASTGEPVPDGKPPVVVLPGDYSYWSLNGAQFKSDILELDSSNDAYYKKRNFTTELAQFDLKSTVVADTWVGLSLRQSNPPMMMWDGNTGYLMIIKPGGEVALLKKEAGQDFAQVAVKTEPSLVDGDFHTVQVGAVDEDEAVRVLLYVDGTKVIDYLDSSNPMKAASGISVVTQGSAKASVRLGAVEDPGNNVPSDPRPPSNSGGSSSSFVPANRYEGDVHVLPTNEDYIDFNGQVTYDGKKLSIGSSSIATYRGSKIDNRVVEFTMNAKIPADKWIGLLLNQSSPGQAVWDQKYGYFILLRHDGGVEVMKKTESSSLSTILKTQSFRLLDGKPHAIRLGSIVESNGGVRLILAVDDSPVLNFVDSSNPVVQSSYFSIATYETASATVSFGAEGFDPNYDAVDDQLIEHDDGAGYRGGSFDADEYVFTPSVLNYRYSLLNK